MAAEGHSRGAKKEKLWQRIDRKFAPKRVEFFVDRKPAASNMRAAQILKLY